MSAAKSLELYDCVTGETRAHVAFRAGLVRITVHSDTTGHSSSVALGAGQVRALVKFCTTALDAVAAREKRHKKTTL